MLLSRICLVAPCESIVLDPLLGCGIVLFGTMFVSHDDLRRFSFFCFHLPMMKQELFGCMICVAICGGVA